MRDTHADDGAIWRHFLIGGPQQNQLTHANSEAVGRVLLILVYVLSDVYIFRINK